MAAAKAIPKTNAKKGLGRGLSALIPDDDMEFLSRVARGVAPAAPVAGVPDQRLSHHVVESHAAVSMASAGVGALQANPDEAITAQPGAEDTALPRADVAAEGAALTEWVDVSRIEANPYQPRRHFSQEELDDLAASIRTHGVLQPILVRPAGVVEGRAAGGEQRYQLVAGERRWRAAQLAGLSRVPAIIRDVADQQALELALIENVQRHDISAMDAALAYRRLATEFKLSQEHIARRVGKSRSAVANTLRLLDLPEEARKAIEDGVITEGHGRAILLASGEGARRAVLRRIVRDHMSVREAERLAQQPAAGDAKADADSAARIGGRLSDQRAKDGTEDDGDARRMTSDLRRAEAQLQKALGTRLHLRPRGKGGTMVVEYSSSDELQRIIELLRAAASSPTRP